MKEITPKVMPQRTLFDGCCRTDSQYNLVWEFDRNMWFYNFYYGFFMMNCLFFGIPAAIICLLINGGAPVSFFILALMGKCIFDLIKAVRYKLIIDSGKLGGYYVKGRPRRKDFDSSKEFSAAYNKFREITNPEIKRMRKEKLAPIRESLLKAVRSENVYAIDSILKHIYDTSNWCHTPKGCEPDPFGTKWSDGRYYGIGIERGFTTPYNREKGFCKYGVPKEKYDCGWGNYLADWLESLWERSDNLEKDNREYGNSIEESVKYEWDLYAGSIEIPVTVKDFINALIKLIVAALIVWLEYSIFKS